MPSHPPSTTESPSPADPSPPAETPTELYFGYSADVPDLTTVDVKTVAPATLAGEPAVLTVIGESHYVGMPALDFHELCSCKPLPHERTHRTPLSAGAEREFSFESDRLDARTVVEGRPLEAFPDPDDATVAYRFDPEAWTTIRIADGGYETYHTYPEYDLALHTETTMTPKTQR
ncbi:hypothetical protein G3A49_07300 [Haloferax volcanii]|uniref:DUF2617 family protein n=1 Tax=Haloferax volcanii TaxID=2246 RepID=A0A6C0UR71_HALVO|nr:hypothetical protein [Haloferax alexandrinus]QIB77954.1 hypothetical protein G3A49_07300 [Haloferax alexandrinus]